MSLPTLRVITLFPRDHVAWEWFEQKFAHRVTIQREPFLPSRPPQPGELVVVMAQVARTLFTHARPNDVGWVHDFNGAQVVFTYELLDSYSFSSREPEFEIDIDEKDSTATQHKNTLFWLWNDVNKLLQPPTIHVPSPRFHLRPTIQDAIAFLSTDGPMVLDIETHPDSCTLNCIGLGQGSDYYTVPIYGFFDRLYYPKVDILNFMAALGDAMCRRPLVLHNAMFDLLFLAMFYRIPFGRVIHDTMLAHHAVFAQVEKSLGHAIRTWSNFRYHKDEGICSTHNARQDNQLWEYNALDLHRTWEVYCSQLEFCTVEQHKGFKLAIDALNKAIYPYAVMSLDGINIDGQKIGATSAALELKATAIERVIKTLIGDDKFNVRSAPQLKKYFFDHLGMDPVARTKTGAPALGTKEIYEMALKYPNNPLWPAIIQYRETVTQANFFKFLPPLPRWKYQDYETSSNIIDRAISAYDRSLQTQAQG